MATFYLDFEGGNDANDGTTFANRWKTINSGATAARTAPGDTIRIMGSPAPTSLGQNGVWTSQALQATKSSTSITNTTPIGITIAGHGYSTGDVVVISGNATVNGTWNITVTGTNTFTLDESVANGTGSASTVRLRTNTCVKLASAVTQNIASTGPERAAWTSGQANVSTGFDTANFKQGRQSDQIIFSVGSTTGLVAYWPTPTSLDLSSYQQISFWIRNETTAAITAGMLELRLCSDNAGVTAVDTFSIPAVVGTSRWQAFTLDKQANLGSAIQSIAIYAMSAPGTSSLRLSNIIACKASSEPDSLTLTSLIGKNTTGETFWGIQSINGTRVMLDADTNAAPTSATVRGYYGTSETVTTWKRETIKLGPAAASTTALQTIQESGTDGSPITYSGGWDRTDMSTQNLETWLDGVNGNGYGISFGTSWTAMTGLAGVRLNRVLNGSATQGTGTDISIIAANSNTGNAIAVAQSGKITTAFLCANIASFSPSATAGSQQINLGNVYSNGALLSGFRGTINSSIQLNSYNNPTVGLRVSASMGGKLINSKFGLNGTSLDAQGDASILYCYNCLFDDSIEYTVGTNGTENFLYSQNHDQTADNHKIFSEGFLISSATDQRKTSSGISWKIQPTSSFSWNSLRPIALSLAKVACAANSLVTVKAWMRRSNTDLTMRLVCKGGQIAGVASDVVDSMTAAADTWAEQTITFTPTEVGVVEITAEAWGGTTFSGWVDDMTISQA